MNEVYDPMNEVHNLNVGQILSIDEVRDLMIRENFPIHEVRDLTV
jgi:hypothetical protein